MTSNNFLYLPTLQHTGTWFAVNFLLSHPDLGGFFEGHQAETVFQEGNYLVSSAAIKRGYDPDKLNLIQTHIKTIESLTKDRDKLITIHPDQCAAMLTNPFIVTLRDPLLALITHRSRHSNLSPIGAIQNWKAFFAFLTAMEKREVKPPIFLPVDLLKTWDYQRVAGILDDILVTYGLRTNNKIVNKWASELPVFNSYGQMMPRLRRAYQNNDLETITELIGNDLKLLQEIEPNLRPLLEQAGYSNLLWWT